MALDPTQRAATPPKPTPEVPPGVQQNPPVVEQVNQVSQAALSAYPDGVIHRWDNLFIANTGPHSWDVLLIKEGNELKYRLENRQTKDSQIGPVPVNPGFPLEIFIKALIEHCEPFIEDEKQLTLSPKLHEYTLPDCKVRLLKGRQQLFWQKWDPLFRTRVYVPLQLTFGSANCSLETHQVLARLARIKLGETVTNLEKFRCTNFTKGPITHLFSRQRKDKNELVIFCPCTVEIGKDGKIDIFAKNLTFDRYKYDHKLECDRFIDFPYSTSLTPYCYDEEDKTHIIFLEEKNVSVNLKKVSPKYKAEVYHNNRKQTSSIQLIPQSTSHTLPQVKNFGGMFTFHFDRTQSQYTPPTTKTDGESTIYSQGFTSECVLNTFSLTFSKNACPPISKDELTYVEFEPLFEASYFDRTLPITHFRWGVSVVAYQGSHGKSIPKSLEGNHAIGILEALNDGFWPDLPFNQSVRFLFHFTGSEIKAKYDNQPKWTERSKVYYVSPEKGKLLVQKVIAEKEEKSPRFDLRGIDACGSKGHNCFTWLRAMLKVADIDLGAKWSGFIFTRTKDWTDTHRPLKNELL